jgi:hypothetical protein
MRKAAGSKNVYFYMPIYTVPYTKRLEYSVRKVNKTGLQKFMAAKYLLTVV